MKMERRLLELRRRGITQKKTYYIFNIINIRLLSVACEIAVNKSFDCAPTAAWYTLCIAMYCVQPMRRTVQNIFLMTFCD